MIFHATWAYVSVTVVGAMDLIWEAAEKGGMAPASVILFAGIIVLGLVIVALDRRAAGSLKVVMEHHDKFEEQVRKERQERNDERKREREILTDLVRENTAAFTAIKEAIALRGGVTHGQGRPY